MMTSDPRGICVIINNENFNENPNQKRNGTQKDVGVYHNINLFLSFEIT